MQAFLKKPLAIATLIACICGLFGLAEPLDQIYWNLRYRWADHTGTNSVTLVQVDGTRAQGGTWNSEDDAQLIRLLQRNGARQIFFARHVNDRDPHLVEAFHDAGDLLRVVVPIARMGTSLQQVSDAPDPSIVPQYRVIYSGWFPNFWNYALYSFTSVDVRGRSYPTLTAVLSNYRTDKRVMVHPDYKISPDRIEEYYTSDIMGGRVSREKIRGKRFIVFDKPDEQNAFGYFGYFGYGPVAPVIADVSAAENLKNGPTLNIGSLSLLAAFSISILAIQLITSNRIRRSVYGIVFLCVIFAPAILERFGLISSPAAMLVGVFVFGGMKLWGLWRRKIQQTSASGLPNFVALAGTAVPLGFEVVVAVIARYEEFLATLPREHHAECARQVARRFSVGCGSAEIYCGESGHFAWIEPERSAEHVVEHFEGMRALFSAPLMVGGHMFDTNVHFGIDRNQELDTLTRLNTALASASEALRHGRTIEQFGANRLANAPWELSLLARIDEGMRNGDIWLAYQPQWDYHEMRISGAEALIRWNDPVRGPIRPDEFIIQAERAGRIDALTYWVLENAITATEAFNDLGQRFQMSINLSAQLVDKPSLISSISEIVRRRNVDCRLLTIEVTETASVYNRPAAIRNLQQLRGMGFHLSIDDFGTGEASLCYLAELPSDELKLDRRFVSRMTTHDRERQIVQATINLAHALRQQVVAEGIEDLATFDLLRQFGCDVGQGYYIGRPETFEQLRARSISVGVPSRSIV